MQRTQDHERSYPAKRTLQGQRTPENECSIVASESQSERVPKYRNEPQWVERTTSP